MPINPKKIRVRHLMAAEGYLALNMPDHALRELDRIETSDDYGYETHFLRGEVLLIKRDHQQALQAFTQAHLTRPTDKDALLRMAWCYKRIDQLQQAIDTMKVAYQSHKGCALVLYNTSCYYALAGDKENALSWLGRALRMDRKYLDLIPEESDFDSLRNDPDFQHLLQLSGSRNS